MLTIKICHITQTVNQCLSGCNDISDQQSTSRNHRQLAVFNLQTCDLILMEHTLTGQETDIMHANMLTIAALLQRIVQCAT